MSKAPIHIHDYHKTAEKSKFGNIYTFFKCMNYETQCPKRHKMKIERRKDLPPEK